MNNSIDSATALNGASGSHPEEERRQAPLLPPVPVRADHDEIHPGSSAAFAATGSGTGTGTDDEGDGGAENIPAGETAGPETGAGEAADSSTGLLELALEGLVHACLLVDSGGRIFFCNEAAKLLFMPKGRLLGRKLETVLADRQLSRLAGDCLATRRPGSLDCLIRLPGEAWREDRHFHVAAVPLPLSGGRWLVRLSLRPDDEADAAARTPPQPAADILIQLRGPLTVVQGYLENLLDGLITDPVALRQSLVTMRRSTLQIERILEGLRQ